MHLTITLLHSFPVTNLRKPSHLNIFKKQHYTLNLLIKKTNKHYARVMKPLKYILLLLQSIFDRFVLCTNP